MQLIKGLCISLSVILFGLGLGAMVEVAWLVGPINPAKLLSSRLFLASALIGLICVAIDADHQSWRLLPWRRQNRRLT